MKADRCREWRESLGAYALGRLSGEERAGVESHVEGCAECRAELHSLAPVASLLPLADPSRLDATPAASPSLIERIAAEIAAEKHQSLRRGRMRRGVALGVATAALAGALLALFVIPGSEEGPDSPERHVTFHSLPPGLEIAATLEPHGFGTEIHMYVKGAPSGTLCRVFLRRPSGTALSAGSFRYRWDGDDAILSSGLDLSETGSIAVRVGRRTFVAPVG